MSQASFIRNLRKGILEAYSPSNGLEGRLDLDCLRYAPKGQSLMNIQEKCSGGMGTRISDSLAKHHHTD